MDDSTPFPGPQFAALPELTLAYYTAGPVDGVPLLLIHGWPEIAFSWANQIQPLAAAGYRVIAMDVRGFGRSDAPRAVSAYQISNLVSDIEGLLNYLNIEQAILCGHDWGGIIVWHAARMLQERITHVISVCTPHVRRAPVDPIEIFRKRYGDDHYFVQFNENPEAHHIFEQDIDAFFRLMFRTTPEGAAPSVDMFHIPKAYQAFIEAGAPPLKGAVMSDADRAVYVKAYARSGFHGGVNLYRNTSANWQLAKGLSDRIAQPSLMISAERDLFLPPAATDPMIDMVPDLERHTIKGCGHWAMWDAPEALNTRLLDWLERRV